jgi:hypothetical protein
MDERILGDREKAMEDAYFRDENARLIEALRERAQLDEIAVALGEKLQLDNPELLLKVRNLGITLDTAPALFLAPLVQVAWADGSASRKESETLLRLARERGVEEGSPAYLQLQEWLRSRPADALFDTALEVLKYGFAVLPPKEQEERIQKIVDACQEVASASGRGLAALIALGRTVVTSEDTMLDAIVKTLRKPT